jgi:glycosyltransferase involved in cell wall biosynthesis
VPHKRVELLLRAVAALRTEIPDVRARIVGRGPSAEPRRARAVKLGIEGAVAFDGFVDRAHKERILAEAWVLAQPSIKEGWGLVVTEAGKLGTPAIAFRVGGLVESVVDGETGLLADDLPEFEDHLRMLLLDGRVRRRLGEQAAAYAHRLSWDRTGEELGAVLERAIVTAAEVPSLLPVLAEA